MLDTNICIYIQKNKPVQVRERFKVFEIGELVLSAITVSELYHGAYKSAYVAQNILALEQFLRPFDILDFDFKASIEYGKIRASLEKDENVIGGLDMMIAAHARSVDAVLVTNNTREFQRVANLSLDNWV